MHYAACYSIPANIRHLLEAGAKINIASDDGLTALMLGVIYNAHENLKLLLQDEALKFDSKDSRGYSALHYAAMYGDAETSHLLRSSHLLKNAELHACLAQAQAEGSRASTEARLDWTTEARDKDPLVRYSAFEAPWDDVTEVPPVM